MRIISDHAIASFGVAIPTKLFGEIFSKPAAIAVGGPYGLASWRIFMDAGYFVNRTSTRPWIRYVFEQGAVGRHRFQRVFDEYEKDEFTRERFRLGALSFDRKTEFTPLQGADILAYQLYRAERVDLGIDAGTRKAQLDLLRPKPNWWWRVREPELREWATALEDTPLAEPRPRNPKRVGYRERRKAKRAAQREQDA